MRSCRRTHTHDGSIGSLHDDAAAGALSQAGFADLVFLTWAALSDYAAKREDLLWRARDVLDWIADGSLKVHIARTLLLTEVAETHRLIESRQVNGKVLLLP